MSKWKPYLQGAAGALVVVILSLITMSIWNHAWADHWQSGELYRLKQQVEQQQQITAEVVKWINNVQAAQQKQQPPAQ